MINTVQNTTFTDRMKFGILHVKNTFQRYLKHKALMSISIFPSLKQVNIALWIEILETQNYCLLDQKYKENKKYSDIQKFLLMDKLTAFYDDYFLRLNNQYAKSNLSEQQAKILLQGKILILHECLKSLAFILENNDKISDAHKKQLEIMQSVKKVSPNFKMQYFDSVIDCMEVVNKLITSNETTYNRLYPENDKKETPKNYSFEKQVVDVEQCLGRTIDINTTNVYKWIELINLAEEISKKRMKDASKG